MSEGKNPQPFYGCSVESCRDETSYPADMLAWVGNEVMCQCCYEYRADYELPKECLDADGNPVHWGDLPRFEDKRDEALRWYAAQTAEAGRYSSVLARWDAYRTLRLDAGKRAREALGDV